MSKALRGRPRKVNEEAIAIDVKPEPDFVSVATTDNSITAAPSASSRLDEVLAMVQPIVDAGGKMQSHNNCVTVMIGGYSECVNITVPDVLIKRMVSRMLKIMGE